MIRVQVLGRFTLEARGEPVYALAAQPLRGSVFLYLCVEREATREALVRMFWPDREEDKARRLLSQTLYELKRALGAEWFTAAGELVRVENVTADAHGFEAALARHEHERALACYNGRFLTDFQRFDSAEFNAWVDRKAAHYERLHRRARRERIKRLLEEGDRNAALVAAQRWSELDPLEDEAQHRTIELLHELGRRSEALQAYETYLAHLKDVDLVPLDETRALAARVRESTMQARPLSAPHPSVLTSTSADSQRDPIVVAGPAQQLQRRRAAALIAGLLLLLVAVPLLLRASFQDGVRTAQLPLDEAGSDLSRVAVLYFDDRTSGGKLDWLAKGITEALIEELTRVDRLSVISRYGVKQFQDSNVSIDSIGRALKVGTIVDGEVRQAGDSVRVRVSLVDARTNVTVEARTLQRPAGEGFQLEDDVVREVGGFLRKQVGKEIQLARIARGATIGEAYRLYQTADDFREQVLAANPRLRVSEFEKYEFLLQNADSMLIEAHRLDPRWIEPVLLRGWLAFDRAMLNRAPGSLEARTHHRSAMRLANEVLENDPGNSGAFELRGAVLMQLSSTVFRSSANNITLLQRADTALRQAVKLDETRATAWSRLSRVLQLLGHLDEAALYAQRALQADAFERETPQLLNRLIRLQMDRNRFDEAEQHCRNARRQFPDDYQFVECALLVPAADPRPRVSISMDSAYALRSLLQQMDPPREASDYTPIFRELLIARLWAKHDVPDSAKVILARARRAASADPAFAGSFPFDAAHVLLLIGDEKAALDQVHEFLRLNPQFYDYIKNSVTFQRVAAQIRPVR